MQGSQNGQFKLEDVPFSATRAKAIEAPSHFDRWKSIVDTARHKFGCAAEQLIQHAVDAFYSNKGQAWRRKLARRIVSIYYGASSLTREVKAAFEAVAKFVQFSLNWLSQQVSSTASAA